MQDDRLLKLSSKQATCESMCVIGDPEAKQTDTMVWTNEKYLWVWQGPIRWEKDAGECSTMKIYMAETCQQLFYLLLN